MNFVGTGKRLVQGDIGKVAHIIGIETAVLLAFIEIEAAGRGFDSKNRPKMLRETHKFYEQLPTYTLRNLAVKAGLATTKWVKNYKADSYPDLDRMILIHKEAALKSCSWGLGQPMGFNYKACGFTDVESMVQAAMQGEYEQLLMMASLMKAWGMIPMLTGKDFTKPDSWRSAARKWNGAGYESNNYHVKAANAYKKHSQGKEMNTPSVRTIPNAVLHKNMKGEAILNLQKDLHALGYEFPSGLDGRFGDETEKNVKAFQKKHKLDIDGKVGLNTSNEIKVQLEKIIINPVPTTPQFDKETKTQTKSWVAGLIALLGVSAGGIAKYFGWF